MMLLLSFYVSLDVLIRYVTHGLRLVLKERAAPRCGTFYAYQQPSLSTFLPRKSGSCSTNKVVASQTVFGFLPY